MSVQLFRGDCLEILPTLPDKNIDAFICDIPYGTTQCAWDSVIPLEPMWKQVKRLLKERGVFVTTSSQPFTSVLVCSNLGWFKYGWVWHKNIGTRFLDAKKRPLLFHEDILVFSENRHTYNPQMKKVKPRLVTRSGSAKQYNEYKPLDTFNNGENYPRTVIEFPRSQETEHPTEKPVSLFEYLILTYTNPGDTVCDFAMGSGTTGEACILTGRDFIGIEIMPEYFAIAQKRIQAAQRQMILPLPEKAEPCLSSS